MSKEAKIEVQLHTEVTQLIEQSKQNVAVAVNTEISLLYWNVGRRINNEILNNERAEYGKKIVHSLSTQLTLQYGKGWSEKQLRQCMQFANVFQDEQIVYALRIQLTWTHIRTIIYMEDPLKRDFYIEMCKLEKWSSRQFQERIQSMLYERTALSKKPEETIKNELEFLKNEKEIENKIKKQLIYSRCLLVLGGTYSNKYWIKKEVEIAKSLGKKVIVVRPWNTYSIPKYLEETADEIIGFNSKAIIKKIK